MSSTCAPMVGRQSVRVARRNRSGRYTVAAVPTAAGLLTVHPRGRVDVSGAALVVTVVPSDATRVVVRVAGELDLAVIDVLTAALDGQLAAARRDLLIDVSGLEFCTCSGLGALLAARHRFVAAGGTLVLTGLGAAMVRLLHLAGLDEVLTPAQAPLWMKRDSTRSPRGPLTVQNG